MRARPHASLSRAAATTLPPSPFVLRVHGPDSHRLSADDVSRLLGDRARTEAGRQRLGRCTTLVAEWDSRIVGVALYERADTSMRVSDVGIDTSAGCDARAIVAALVDALEVACQAAGSSRLVFLSRAVQVNRVLLQRGYRVVRAGCAGQWLEKDFS